LKYYIRILLIIIVLFSSNRNLFSQVYSIDVKAKASHHFSIKKIFNNPERKERRKQKKIDRDKDKKIIKDARNERKNVKKYWKTLDKPKEMAANRKVLHRMKKDLRKSQRINKNKNPDNFFVRLSRKKIKLPKISTSKLHWPWAKKSSNE
jgi:hypothetical protein